MSDRAKFVYPTATEAMHVHNLSWQEALSLAEVCWADAQNSQGATAASAAAAAVAVEVGGDHEDVEAEGGEDNTSVELASDMFANDALI